jgi:hypothetical protein
MALLAFLFFALISVKTRVGPAYCDTSGEAVIAKFVDAHRKRNSLSRGASPERLVKLLGFARSRLAGRLMFLLFCFFLGCHEESSGEQFSLGNVFNYLPGPLPETALLIVGIAALIQDIAVLHPRCQYNYCGVSHFPLEHLEISE